MIKFSTGAKTMMLSGLLCMLGCGLTDEDLEDGFDPLRRRPPLLRSWVDSLGVAPMHSSPSTEGDVVSETVGPQAGKITRFYRLKHIEGKVLASTLENWVGDGRIINYPQLNMVIITASEEAMTQINKVIDRLDAMPPQVLIEARIVELRKSTGFEFGFELRVDRTTASNSPLRKFSGIFVAQSFLDSLLSNRQPNDSPYAFTGATFQFASVGNQIRDLGDYDYILQALQSTGYAKILSAPTIAVHVGEKAEIKAVTNLPIEVTNITNNRTTITVTFKEVGVTLVVEPKVIGTEGILLSISPSVSSVTSFQESTSSGIAIPVISQRHAKTVVEVNDGEVLNIGGLFEHRMLQQNRGYPILSSIPVIGEFFKSRKNEDSQTQIYFILEATILGKPTATRRLIDPRLLPDREEQGESE